MGPERDTALVDLARRVADGAEQAWRELWVAIEPTLWAVTGKWRIVGPLSEREDDRRNIVLVVMERLRDDRFRRVRSFLESLGRRGEGSFRAWVATVAAHTAIDYVRTHAEYSNVRRAPGAPESAGSRWVRLDPMPESGPAAGGPSSQELARVTSALVLLERAKHLLRQEQLDALRLWLEDHDHAEIAERLELPGAAEADKLVRSALKRLRDRYAGKGEEPRRVEEGAA